MIPYDNFYNTLYANLLSNSKDTFEVRMIYFMKFNNIVASSDLFFNDPIGKPELVKKNHLVLFYDQEPLIPSIVESTINTIKLNHLIDAGYNIFIATSEHSEFKDELIKKYGMNEWYYFYHGFAALEWFRDFKYFPKSTKPITKLFLSLNNLMTTDRSYRLNLVANYVKEDLIKHGTVSLPLRDQTGDIKDEIFSQTSKLSKAAKKLVYEKLYPLDKPFVADTDNFKNVHSAKIDMEFQQHALWHIVSETVFYYKKQHLTEKIFKPIIARRPFMLVAAPGNLAYLKSYGFKTFGKWIDESYDEEQDDDLRIQKVVVELKKLSLLSLDELHAMHREMDEILDYNYEHFYHGNFQRIIVDEMLDNFKKCMGKVDNFPLGELDFDAVRTRFLR